MQQPLSPVVVIAIVILGVVEVALLVAAWVVLFRTPSSRLTLPKWAWAVICLIQFVGPIVFFVAGRTPAAVEDPAKDVGPVSSDRVIDDLYGDSK